MERPVRARFNTQIHEEACEWFIECRAGDLDNTARAEFDRWLRKSPEHLGAYLEIAAIWNEGPTLDPSNRWDLDTLISRAAADPGNIVSIERNPRPAARTPQPGPAHEPNRTHSSNDRGNHAPLIAKALEPRHRKQHSRRRLFSIAASIVLVTAAMATYLLASGGVYATTVGEQRSLALADGSTVQLNSLSRIRVQYSDHERIVDLLQGQALFHVAKDAFRPFIVRSGEIRVKAVGTEFDVYRKADGIVVTVVEGRVALSGGRGEPKGNNRPNEGSSNALPSAIVLAAGEQITVTPNATRRTPHPNLAGATAWTQRQLVFDSASLSDVAGEFNRYNERKLIIDASALGTLHISGVFSSTDPASLIRFLRDRPGLRVTETPTQIRVEKEY